MLKCPCWHGSLPLHRHMADMRWRGETKLSLVLLCVDMAFWSRTATSLQNVTGQSRWRAQGLLRTLTTLRLLDCLSVAREALILCSNALCRPGRAPADAARTSTDKRTSRFLFGSVSESGSVAWRLMRLTSPRRAPAALRTVFWTFRQWEARNSSGVTGERRTTTACSSIRRVALRTCTLTPAEVAKRPSLTDTLSG